MRDLVARASLALRRAVVSGAIAAPLVAVTPAAAQDLFGFFRLFSAPSVRVPVEPQYRLRPLPDFDAPLRRRARLRVVRTETPKPPLKPKPMGQVDNPVPELLVDSTLRRGDIVMFPDGPRVFAGEHGTRHTLADFERIDAGDRSVSPALRKVAATLKPGVNVAWSTDHPASGKLAAKDVETTGSTKRARR
jgi:hypothetical protein